MDDFWYLDACTDTIKYAGKFDNYDECDEALEADGVDPVWIFHGEPAVETKDNQGNFIMLSNESWTHLIERAAK